MYTDKPTLQILGRLTNRENGGLNDLDRVLGYICGNQPQDTVGKYLSSYSTFMQPADGDLHQQPSSVGTCLLRLNVGALIVRTGCLAPV